MISPYVIAAMGERMAHRYMLTGEEFDAAEAYRIGFIHDIVEDEELNARVGTLLTHLYSSGPKAIVAAKQLIAFAAQAPIDERTIEETSRRIAQIRATPEAQEGLTAFLEKRRPVWVAPPAKPRSRGKKRGKAR
jgi:methylglutaconyl-CoA hydratase